MKNSDLRLRPVLLLALSLLLLGLPALVGAQESDVRADRWSDRLGDIHTQLAEENYTEARDVAVSLTEEMLDHLGAGDNAEYTMAVVTAFRALAETGLGNSEDGLWFWRTATILYPAFAERDLSVYGEPAEWLVSQEFRGDFQAPVEITDVQPPSVVESMPAPRPGAIGDLETENVEVAVEVIIGVDGDAREPRLVEAPEVPSVVFSALDTLRQWRFEPATLSATPVAVGQTVVVPLAASEPETTG
ncbi:MAG: hypothetical protein R3234_07575 [Thermoanaerobaculia bacterium]|nr:hypothetical protein [Thermoanaerobaculia bacterium]